MEGLDIGLDLLKVLLVAIAGGLAASWLRLPVILGYLLGGIIIGPYGLAWIGDTGTVNSLAEIGVVLLLFALGLEFSLKELMKIGKIALLGGAAQIFTTSMAGFGLGRLVGLDNTGAIFFGFIISMSSTLIVLKVLIDRGELDTVPGRIMLGILLVQDLSVVPMMVVLPAFSGDTSGLALELALALAKAMGFIGLMLVLGIWGMPWLLKRVAGQRSRELFLITVICLCLGAAVGTYYFGLSAALGAFAAGLLISQSGYARQAFADILPLRDTFASIFFISLGMLMDLQFIQDNPGAVATAVIAIFLIKFIICSSITRLFGYGLKTALQVGTGLVQIGEFSFILARMGFSSGILSDRLYYLTISAAIVTMLLTPLLITVESRLYRRFSQKPWLARIFTAVSPQAPENKPGLSRHAVICGCGTVGSRIAEVLDKQKFPYMVIDLEPTVISRLRSRGIPCIYGDASNPAILAHTGLERARILICTVPDYVAAELIASNARKINPRLDIVARVHRDTDAELLKNRGVTEIVLPFFEASLEMIRHTLHRFGVSSTEIQYILNGLRQQEKKD